MPTKTWDNLDPEKRERILHAAIREFGANGFSSGSLNVVAREAEVAKGSLFQYFDDKLDLFGHVCDVASRKVRDEMLERLAGRAAEHDDVFDMLRAVLFDWVVFYKEHELERAVTFAVNFEIREEARVVVRAAVKRYYLEVLTAIVEDAIAKGQMRDDLSRAHLISILLLVLPHLALAPTHPELEPTLALDTVDEDELRRHVEGYIDVLAAAYRPR